MVRNAARLIGVFLVFQALASTVAEPMPAAAPRGYADPNGRFVLAVPPEADVAQRPDGIQLSIRSVSKGYAINLQTGAANPSVALPDMIRKLEALHLGRSGTWTVKLGERTSSVAGLPAYEALYEGSRTRWRVVIARGRQTDFVFMFMASPYAFEALGREFDWVLANFRPAATEVPQGPARPPVSAPPGPEAEGAKRFADDGLGYTVEYPGDWIIERPTSFTVVFSGAEGTEACYATVRIQNFKPYAVAGPAAAARSVLADLKSKLASGASNLAYLGEGPFVYDKQGLRLEGYQLFVSYTNRGQRFRQWTVVMPRSSGAVIHIWSYASQHAQFDAFRGIAENMLRTWTLDMAAAQPRHAMN